MGSSPDGRFEELQRRINARLLTLNETPTALATRHGLGRDFIRDFLYEKPRRRTIRSDKLARLASALDCDEGYLTLRQAAPRLEKPEGRGEAPARERVRFGGRLRAGAWFAASAAVEANIPVLPSVHAAGLNIDTAYVQEDDTLAAKGIRAGAVLYAEKGAKSKPGDIVVLRRTMGPLVELSARVKVGDGRYELALLPGSAEIEEPNRSRFREVEEGVVRISQTWHL